MEAENSPVNAVIPDPDVASAFRRACDKLGLDKERPIPFNRRFRRLARRNKKSLDLEGISRYAKYESREREWYGIWKARADKEGLKGYGIEPASTIKRSASYSYSFANRISLCGLWILCDKSHNKKYIINIGLNKVFGYSEGNGKNQCYSTVLNNIKRFGEINYETVAIESDKGIGTEVSFEDHKGFYEENSVLINYLINEMDKNGGCFSEYPQKLAHKVILDLGIVPVLLNQKQYNKKIPFFRLNCEEVSRNLTQLCIHVRGFAVRYTLKKYQSEGHLRTFSRHEAEMEGFVPKSKSGSRDAATYVLLSSKNSLFSFVRPTAKSLRDFSSSERFFGSKELSKFTDFFKKQCGFRNILTEKTPKYVFMLLYKLCIKFGYDYIYKILDRAASNDYIMNKVRDVLSYLLNEDVRKKLLAFGYIGINLSLATGTAAMSTPTIPDPVPVILPADDVYHNEIDESTDTRLIKDIKHTILLVNGVGWYHSWVHAVTLAADPETMQEDEVIVNVIGSPFCVDRVVQESRMACFEKHNVCFVPSYTQVSPNAIMNERTNE